jgi:hypothetical protein
MAVLDVHVLSRSPKSARERYRRKPAADERAGVVMRKVEARAGVDREGDRSRSPFEEWAKRISAGMAKVRLS